MKTPLTIIAFAFLATTAGADDVYRGLATGNPDISEPHPSAEEMAAPRPSAQSPAIDMHHGLSDGNPDLSQVNQPPDPSASRSGGEGFDMHHGLSDGNPDLSPPPNR